MSPSPKPGWEIVDGSDVTSVWHAVQVAFDYIRTTGKPYLLELRTERGRHHSSSSNPSGQILESVKAADPLLKFETQLQQAGVLSVEQMSAMQGEIKAKLMAEAAEIKLEKVADDAFSGMYYQGSLPV